MPSSSANGWLIGDIWVYLAASPLLHLTLTVAVYLGCRQLQRWVKGSPLLNPVALSVAVLVAVLWLTQTPYENYFAGAQFIHFLLGPATVALAVPLYRYLPQVKQLLLPLAVALLGGCVSAILSAYGLAYLAGGSAETLLSLAPKSVTTPVAMGVAEKIGGLPSLTAVLVILTGIIGAVAGPTLLRTLRIEHPAIQGFAIGVASHGIGATRAFQISALAGAFAGLAMALNALLTVLLTPLLVGLLR